MQGVRYGKNGFFHDQRIEMNAMDIGSIDQGIEGLIAKGIARKEGDLITLDMSELGVDKVLGSGRATHPMKITAKAFSEQAKAKIEEIGGQALTS